MKKSDGSLVDVGRNKFIVTTVENFDKHENGDNTISEGNATLDDKVDGSLVLKKVIQ